MKSWLFALVIGLISTSATALTWRTVEVSCPIGNHTFEATVAGSGTAFGQLLDLRYIGPIADPPPLPKCPYDGFVLSDLDLSPQQLKTLKAYVHSKEYRSVRYGETSHWLAYLLLKKLDFPTSILALTMLSATWEASDISEEQYQRYAKETLKVYKAFLKELDERLIEKEAPSVILIAPGVVEIEDQGFEIEEIEGETVVAVDDEEEREDYQEKIDAEFIAGELERRLGNFTAAKKRFEALKEVDICQQKSDMPAVCEAIIDQQLQLINRRDTDPHVMKHPDKTEEEWQELENIFQEYRKEQVRQQLNRYI